MRRIAALLALIAVTYFGSLSRQVMAAAGSFAPGSRSVMDAHNCYPYFEWWYDRIDRALSAGTPLAIEQDLGWYTDPKTKQSWTVVTHGSEMSGHEPTMEHYFFDKVRPVVEKALANPDHSQWPLITLNLDFKTEEPENLRAVWKELESHRAWLSTATKTPDGRPQPITLGPILVLTGESDAQQKVFYDDVPAGGELLLFGAVHTHDADPMAAPAMLETERASAYRRWWNNPWDVVEAGGQTKAGEWTAADNSRLRALVEHAHQNGLWIRFYTLDGATKEELSCRGWFHGYNFGSEAAAETRWRAAQQAGVDYIASDQYEALGAFLKSKDGRNEAGPQTCR